MTSTVFGPRSARSRLRCLKVSASDQLRRWIGRLLIRRLEYLYGRGKVSRARWEICRLRWLQPADGSRVLRLMMKQKDWSGANELYNHWQHRQPELLAQLKKSDIKRLQHFATRDHDLAAYLQHNPLNCRLPVDHVNLTEASWDSHEIKGGKISIRCYRHNIYGRGPERMYFRIFEKIYDASTSIKAEREVQLFSNVSTEALMAPRFLGVHRTAEFTSVFYEYVEPARIPIEEWDGTRLEINRRLAQLEPPWSPPFPKTTPHDHSLQPLRILSRGSRLDDFLGELYEIRLKRREPEKVLANVATYLQSSPHAIIHRDLSRENVFKARNSGYYLVDWDKWSLEPVGAGLQPGCPTILAGGAWDGILAAVVRSRSGCETEVVKLAAAVGTLSKALRAQDRVMARRWIDLVLYYWEGMDANH